MTEIYSQADLHAIKKQKKTVYTVYFAVLTVFILLSVGILIFYNAQDFGTPLKTPLLLLEILLSSAFIIFSFVFIELKIKRVKAYCSFLNEVFEIENTKSVNVFVRHDKTVSVKNKVEFTSLIFLEWSEKQHEYYEISVYFDVEKIVPNFKKGDKVYYKKYSNVLPAYDIHSDDIFK